MASFFDPIHPFDPLHIGRIAPSAETSSHQQMKPDPFLFEEKHGKQFKDYLDFPPLAAVLHALAEIEIHLSFALEFASNEECEELLLFYDSFSTKRRQSLLDFDEIQKQSFLALWRADSRVDRYGDALFREHLRARFHHTERLFHAFHEIFEESSLSDEEQDHWAEKVLQQFDDEISVLNNQLAEETHISSEHRAEIQALYELDAFQVLIQASAQAWVHFLSERRSLEKEGSLPLQEKRDSLCLAAIRRSRKRTEAIEHFVKEAHHWSPQAKTPRINDILNSRLEQVDFWFRQLQHLLDDSLSPALQLVERCWKKAEKESECERNLRRILSRIKKLLH